jgi:hypothetical protein
VAEWLKAAVLKTVVRSAYRGFESLLLRHPRKIDFVCQKLLERAASAG